LEGLLSTLGYIRVSTDQQDLEKQRHLLLEYAHKNKIVIDDFIEIEISSQKDKKKRRIDEILNRMKNNDVLIVAELSRLGRNMLEVLNIINELNNNGVKIIFVRQPELSTEGSHSKLLLAIYSYFAETEREFISVRTKQGLAAVRAQGIILGRPKGSKNKKNRQLDPFKLQIAEYLSMELTLSAIRKIINKQLDKPLTYNSFKFFVNHDEVLALKRKKKLGITT
jgi:DNA invertase Pin-like site-specific DNA recombinase